MSGKRPHLRESLRSWSGSLDGSQLAGKAARAPRKFPPRDPSAAPGSSPAGSIPLGTQVGVPEAACSKVEDLGISPSGVPWAGGGPSASVESIPAAMPAEESHLTNRIVYGEAPTPAGLAASSPLKVAVGRTDGAGKTAVVEIAAGAAGAGDATSAGSVGKAGSGLGAGSAASVESTASSAISATVLFAGSLAVYLLVRLAGLEDFPIFFFTDEAVQTVLAADFVRDGLRNYDKEFLPTYFNNGPTYNLSSLSVYLQVLPVVLFGKSVFITRAVSVGASMLAAGAVSLALRDVFKARFWWAGVLLLSVMPAWFYHSRTAFETVEMTAFYATFLSCYLLYRTRSRRYLYPALVFGALVFYTYSPGQLVMLVSGLLLLASDFSYHRGSRRTVIGGLLVLALLSLPFLRWYIAHPDAALLQLAMRAPYWFQSLSLGEKLMRASSSYLAGLDPRYWFIPHELDLPRHLMKGHGHLPWLALPFLIIGLGEALKRLREPQYRAVLLAVLAVPAGAALVGPGITRLLAMVVPLSLLAGLGLSRTAAWLEDHRLTRLPQGWLPAVLFAALTLANLAMLRDGIINGPTWYRSYGLDGMQYGARQVFAAVQKTLAEEPETRIILSPTWANGTDVVARFFLGDPLPVQMGSVQGHLVKKLPLDSDTLFIMTPDEYRQALESGKFAQVEVERTLPYPDGEAGFYFTRLAYIDEIDRIFEMEREQRLQLQESLVFTGGQMAKVRYPALDIGEIAGLFDGNPSSFARTLEANPFVVEISLPQARPVSGMSVTVGSILAGLEVSIYEPASGQPVVITSELQGTVRQPEVRLDFGEAYLAQMIRLEVKDLHQPEPGHVHIWELVLHP